MNFKEPRWKLAEPLGFRGTSGFPRNPCWKTLVYVIACKCMNECLNLRVLVCKCACVREGSIMKMCKGRKIKKVSMRWNVENMKGYTNDEDKRRLQPTRFENDACARMCLCIRVVCVCVCVFIRLCVFVCVFACIHSCVLVYECVSVFVWLCVWERELAYIGSSV